MTTATTATTTPEAGTTFEGLTLTEQGVKLGAGEIVMNSIDADGTREGYDLDLLRTVSDAVPVPVVASGGAGSIEHIRDALVDGRAHAALAASIFHFKLISIERVKRELAAAGLPMRMDPFAAVGN